ncbi:MAG: hypothetical protein ACXAC7_07105 [Candidatus Hodarchaeales archaeon]|jgi:hypothetical protein
MNYITIRKQINVGFSWAEISRKHKCELVSWLEEEESDFLTNSFGANPQQIALAFKGKEMFDEIIKVPPLILVK